MNNRFLLLVVFAAGVSSGWLGKSWLESIPSELAARVTNNLQNAVTGNNNSAPNLTPTLESTNSNSSSTISSNQQIPGSFHPQQEQHPGAEPSSATTTLALFNKLLNDRLYYDAMVLYQEQAHQNQQTASQLKRALLERLSLLSESRNNTDFTELTENYLSIYYDDIDVLLLLADFNRANGSYLETVDVYLLAKTYAYTDADQQKLLVNFNDFIEEIDYFYTNQKNWLSLINLYSHIDASGLMTSPYQYRQALAHLRNGDEYLAIEQLQQLSNDSLVGEQAALTLNSLTGSTDTIAPVSTPAREDSEAIPLQQLGNQYLVNLTINREDDVKLLIDTGASMTTLSQSSFDSLYTNQDAVAQDRRIFRTANGVIKGTVYSVAELSLGPYTMKDTQIAVLDFEMPQGINGLLGMNVLGQFRFQIDQEKNNLLLNSK